MGRPARVTREQVLQAARTSFAERGFDGTTLAAIGARLGISPAAVLRHAPGKAALFAAAFADPQPGEASPLDFLQEVGEGEDPAGVLRRVAKTLIPFVEAKWSESMALWLHARSARDARTLRLPFDPKLRPTPPERALGRLSSYFLLASSAGKLRVRDPRAAALAFLGSLQLYVFNHKVLGIVEPPIPLDLYVETIVEVWTRGAIPEERSRP